jgi:transcriptional regulator with XRE-family HTH domain
MPRAENLFKLADALGVSVEELFTAGKLTGHRVAVVDIERLRAALYAVQEDYITAAEAEEKILAHAAGALRED